MDHQALNISNICQQGEEFQTFGELLCLFCIALNRKGENRTCTVREVLVIQFLFLASRQGRMVNLFYLRMILQEVDNLQCIFYVPFYPQRQGFQTLQQQEGIERREYCTLISHQCGTNLHDISSVSACFCKYNAVVRRIRLAQTRELVVLCPVELSAVNDDTTHNRTMTADELCCRVYNNVCTMFQRTQQIWRCKSAVHNQWNSVLVSNRSQCFQINDI